MNIFGSEKVPPALIAGVVIILAGMAACAWWLLSDRDVVLFDRLEAQQLDAVSAELDRAGFAHEVDRQDGTIRVEPAEAQRARLAVMSSGNAFRNSTGFELFDRSDFGMTDFAQKINYQRAIEGELARTISALAEIKFARVHLVLPENGLFRREQRPARAAVTIFPENGAMLMPENIMGLQRIVAAAVPELRESDVTITDESGRVLSAVTAAEGTELQVGGRLAQKQAVERYLADKVRGVLAKALGAEHFAVSVDVELDFSRKTTRTERVLDANAGSAIQRIKESTRSNEGAVGANDRQKEVEYSLGHEVEEVEHGAGAIRRMQVGVIIDRDIENVDVGLLSEIVGAAIGVDAQRGDRIAIIQHGIAIQRAIEQASVNVPATPPAPPPAQPAATEKWATVEQLWARLPLWSIAVALLLAVGAGAVGVQRSLARRNERRLQQLRHRLHTWIEAEAVEVGKS